MESLLGEKSANVSDYLSGCQIENGSVRKIIGLCSVNMDFNFGGAERKSKKAVL